MLHPLHLLTSFVAAVLFFAGASVETDSSDIKALTLRTFWENVGHGRPSLVVFGTPWCGHCKRMAPDYARLAGVIQSIDSLLIAKVDCDIHRPLCDDLHVRIYPSVLWFSQDGKAVEKVPPPYSYKSLGAFLNSKLPSPSGEPLVPPEEEHRVVELDDLHFDHLVKSTSRNAIVNFCSHSSEACKAFSQTFRRLADVFDSEAHVLVGQLDASIHDRMRERYNIRSYPTILWFSKFNKLGELYTGGTSLEELVAFVNSRAGTQKTVSHLRKQ